MLSGNPVSEGIAIGPLYLYRPFHPHVQEAFCASAEAELERFLRVKTQALDEIHLLLERMAEDAEKAKIFASHEDVLNDPAMEAEIASAIREKRWCGDWALWSVFEAFIRMLEQVSDPLIRERAADLKDVRNRLLRLWLGEAEQNLSALPGPVVIACHDLLPSDTATLDRENVLAIVTETGGTTSHSAIIARSYALPAVLGVSGLLRYAEPGAQAVVDAVAGTIILGATQQEQAEYGEKLRRFTAEAERTKAFLNAEPRMADGTYIELGLNIASPDAPLPGGGASIDYVGLFRTEFLYMGRSTLPGEEEQFEAYRRVLTAMKGKPVTLRTLDIGGDKSSECLPLPKEENPFLGNRALRLCFSMPELFRVQLRAALRASIYGNLWLMLPMVGGMDDILKAKDIIASVRAELAAEGKPVADGMKTGIMIEIPSIALMADKAAREVDFASIGSNDLCQYLTATDRGNPLVSAYYQSYHPALFRIIAMAAEAFHREGKPIGICGELGGDALAVPVLIGLGLRKLSMGAASVAKVKQILGRLTLAHAQALSAAVCESPDAQEAEALMRAWSDRFR